MGTRDDREWQKIKRRVSPHVYCKTPACCYYCGNLFEGDQTIDHVIPIALGGTNELDNLVPCCMTCNRSKGMKTVEEFRRHLITKRGVECGIPEFSYDQICWLYVQEFWPYEGVAPVNFWFENTSVAGQELATNQIASPRTDDAPDGAAGRKNQL